MKYWFISFGNNGELIQAEPSTLMEENVILNTLRGYTIIRIKRNTIQEAIADAREMAKALPGVKERLIITLKRL